MVLTAPGVNETSGFLTQYCGWHTYGTYGSTNIKYAFIGDAAGPRLGNCAQQTGKSPNGDPGVDAMVSVMSHELEESASDPLLNAWYDSSGNENADKCAWTFGTTYTSRRRWHSQHDTRHPRFPDPAKLAEFERRVSCVLAYNPGANFTLSVSPASLSVTQGATAGPYTVTETPVNGYVGNPCLFRHRQLAHRRQRQRYREQHFDIDLLYRPPPAPMSSPLPAKIPAQASPTPPRPPW